MNSCKPNGKGKYRVDLQLAAAHLGCPMATILKQLDSLSKSADAGVKYQLQERCFVFYPMQKLLALENFEAVALIASLLKRLRQVEHSSLSKLRVLYNDVLTAIRSGDANESLRQAAERYFLVEDLGQLSWPEDVATALEDSAHEDKYVRGDIFTLLRNAARYFLLRPRGCADPQRNRLAQLFSGAVVLELHLGALPEPRVCQPRAARR